MMYLAPNEYRQKLTMNGAARVVYIPEDFVLGGTEIVVRQEKDGVITIHPGDEIGWQIFDDAYFPKDEGDLPVAG